MEQSSLSGSDEPPLHQSVDVITVSVAPAQTRQCNKDCTCCLIRRYNDEHISIVGRILDRDQINNHHRALKKQFETASLTNMPGRDPAKATVLDREVAVSDTQKLVDNCYRIDEGVRTTLTRYSAGLRIRLTHELEMAR